MGLRYYGPNGPVDVGVADYVKKVAKPYPICKDCKHYEQLLSLHGFCRGNDYLAPNKVTGEMEWQYVLFAKQARQKGQPCGPKGSLYEKAEEKLSAFEVFFNWMTGYRGGGGPGR